MTIRTRSGGTAALVDDRSPIAEIDVATPPRKVGTFSNAGVKGNE
jgi:hypothetical protein